MVAFSFFFLIINLIIIVALFKLISRFIRPRFSRGVAFKVFLAYSVVLLISPLIVTFALDFSPDPDEVVEAPEFYYGRVLEDYENRTLEGLKEDEYLLLTDETLIPADVMEFSDEQPLRFSTRHQQNDYAFHVIVEVTDRVEDIVVTQFHQRATLNDIEITDQMVPWRWTVTGNRLQAEIPQIEINMYVVSPVRHYFHFDREHTFRGNHFHTMFPDIGSIQWIQIPADLPFEYTGDPEFLKLIERR